MSTNNAFYGFDDEEEGNKNPTTTTTTSKKKKKKKKSKKSSDKNKKNAANKSSNGGLNNNPAFVMKQKLMKQGYDSTKIDQCLDSMFTSGERYDDYESVKAKLDGKTVDGGENSNVDDSSNSNDKSNNNNGSSSNNNKTNHQQVRAASSSSSNNNNNNNNTADNEGWENVSNNNNSKKTQQNDNSNNDKEPSIADRLEAATKMKPCSTVMEVLTRWCMQFPDDLIELFRCKAASQLLENYLTDRYLPTKQSSSNDINLMAKLLSCIFKDKLSKLIMFNLKSFITALKDLSLDKDEWRLVVKRYSNLLSSRLSEFMQYGDQVESIPQDLKKLQDHMQANVVAADEFGNDNGDENIANTFRRRDLACERIVLGNLIRKNTSRLAKAVGSANLNNTRNNGSNKNQMVSARNEKNDARILESLGMSVERINESNQKGEEAKEVQKQLNKLRAENKSKIEPLEKEEKQANDAISTLEDKKKQLMQQLESVQGELDVLYGTKSSVTARKEAINMEMETKLTKLDNEHKGMAVHLRRAESQSKIAKDFREFDEELAKQSRDGNEGAKIVQDRLANALQKAGGANAISKSSNDVLRTALSYTRMELTCLTLMRTRVKENKEKIVKTTEEIASMKTLGLTNVVSQLERTKSQLAQYIEQDEGVVGALSNKAMEIFNIVKAIGDDHAKDIDSLDGLTSDLLQDLKKNFIQLNVGDNVARHWNPPKKEGVEDNGSNSMFGSNLAANLGIAPTTKTSSSSSSTGNNVASSSENKTAAKTNGNSDNSNNNKNNNNVNKSKKVKKSNNNKKDNATAAPAKKMGWGAIPKQQKTSKSLLELQAEELEGRLTEENLRRLEIGKKPAKSPLLDRLKAEIEGGQ